MKKVINSPWIISLGSTAFGVILTMIIDIVKDKPILSTLENLLVLIKEKFILIMRLKLELWWLLVGILIIVLFKNTWYKMQQNKFLGPTYIDYTSDIFKNWEWKWKWKWKFNTYKKSWEVTDLKAKCPTCGSTLLKYNDIIYGYSFECPMCSFSSRGESAEHPTKIEMLIVDKANKMI